MNKTVCELCFPKAVEIASIGEDIMLFENEGRYGLMGYDGHKNSDVYFYFPSKPIPDPDPECAEDTTPEQDIVIDKWIDDTYKVQDLMKMEAWAGHIFSLSCIEAGYGTPKQNDCGFTGCSFSCWLFHYCGKLIEEWEKK